MLHAPEACDRLSKCPITLRTQRSVNRGLHDGNASAVEVFPKHEFEWDEDTVVKARPFETPSI